MKSVVEHTLRNPLIALLYVLINLCLRRLIVWLFVLVFKVFVIFARHVKDKVVIDLLVNLHYLGWSL